MLRRLGKLLTLLLAGTLILAGSILLLILLVSFTSWPQWVYGCILVGGISLLLIPEVRASARAVGSMVVGLIVGLVSSLVIRAMFWIMIRSAKAESHDGIQLLSTEEDQAFFLKTHQALDLIKDKDPLNYRRAQCFLRFITDFGIGGHYDSAHKAFHVDMFLFKNESLEEYAAEIIHEAIHGRLDRCRIPHQREPARHESICQQVQVRFLKRIGQDELAHGVQLARDWWLPEALKGRVAAHIESQREQLSTKPGLLNRWSASFYGALASWNRKPPMNGEGAETILRTYKQGSLDVFEIDNNGDGKADTRVYVEGGAIRQSDSDSQGSGRWDYRGFYTDGRLTRCEWLSSDGAIEKLGYVKYLKQGTQSEIYWTNPNGQLESVAFCNGPPNAGESAVGYAAVDSMGVVTAAQGRTRYKMGEKVSIDLSQREPDPLS